MHASHYDIALSKRQLAIRAGAIEIAWREARAVMMRRLITGSMGEPQEAYE